MLKILFNALTDPPSKDSNQLFVKIFETLTDQPESKVC